MEHQSAYDTPMQVMITARELTELDELVAAALEEARDDVDSTRTDSEYEEAGERLRRLQAIQEKIQYHLS